MKTLTVLCIASLFFCMEICAQGPDRAISDPAGPPDYGEPIVRGNELDAIIPVNPIVLREVYDNYTTIEMERGNGVGKYNPEPGDERKNNGESFTRFMVFRGLNGTPHFSIGLGIGLDLYKESTLIPIMTDIRVIFFNKPITPFTYLHFGFASGIFDKNIKGGLLINGGIGLRAALMGRTSLHLGLGYDIQRLETKRNAELFSSMYNLRFVTIKLGMTF